MNPYVTLPWVQIYRIVPRWIISYGTKINITLCSVQKVYEGEVEIDIQPMLTSAMAFGDPRMFGDMHIGKWLKSDDNALIEDSIVNIVDGKVKREIYMKLQNVESGEINLELEWMPLEQ